MNHVTITSLDYDDQLLTELDLPGGSMRVLRGIGSGLSRGADGRLWAVGDRGPNLNVEAALERFGPDGLDRLALGPGAKVMPCVDIGPAISELRLSGGRVDIVGTIPLRTPGGATFSGLPVPGGDHCKVEPAVDRRGGPLSPDLAGADTEGIVALADGSFWVGDEYGPSLLHVAADGRVLMRWVPAGSEAHFAGAPYPVMPVLPALASRRQINRGFEALGISPDQTALYLAFQSPLAHPDEAAHRNGRWLRVWTLCARQGQLLAQHAYPLDAPETFARDRAAGPFDGSDLKVSELTVLGAGHLLILERGSHTAKLYAVRLEPELALPREHADPSTKPSLEQLSRSGGDLPLLRKRLLFSTDDHPSIGPDLEGMTLLAPNALLLVNDNDFGVEDAATRFWRIDFPHDLA